MAKFLGRHPIAPAVLAVSLLILGSGCSLLDPDEEEPKEPLKVSLVINESNLRGGPVNWLCPGSLRMKLDIEGGRAPYEAVLLLSQTTHATEGVSTQYGPVESTPRVMLKQSFEAAGGFDLQHPAIAFTPRDPATRQIAPLLFTAVVKDRDSRFSFAGYVVGQPAQPIGHQDPLPQNVTLATSVDVLSFCQ